MTHSQTCAIALLISVLIPIPDGLAQAARNCNTALSRIAKAAAVKGIEENKTTACSGLKQGPIAVDTTKQLELVSFELCEMGPVVQATLSVKVKCATSDAAVIKLEVEDTAAATATANLDTCEVTNARVTARNLVSQLGLALGQIDTKLKEAVAKEIKPYCK